ncbi:hypothetical protein PanWU01x14_091450 [Parasponia andersonii]|uniref:Uncharacterized protein n=1 Tax=Parasponia andersonii TaxID=3476 RepID=A0A2P5D738_PARAD|nr:hypothetical protein PanWU01x14_091450 [Parasponia andersonii]
MDDIMTSPSKNRKAQYFTFSYIDAYKLIVQEIDWNGPEMYKYFGRPQEAVNQNPVEQESILALVTRSSSSLSELGGNSSSATRYSSNGSTVR